MGLDATLIPTNAAAEINIDDDDNVVMSQETLCALLELCPSLMSGLHSSLKFGAGDCDALLSVVRQVLVFADAPIYSPDSAEMSRLQTLALDNVAQALLNSDSDSVAARVVGELATLSVLPYALRLKRGESVLMSDSAVVKAAGCVYFDESRYIERLEVLAGQTTDKKRRHARGRRSVAPTFEALGRAAVGRLGAALCDDQALALRVLESGAWLSSVVAMGLHLIQSDDAWFVRTVPFAMSRLPSGPALDSAWMAIGSVVALRMGQAEGDSIVKQGVLDAISESSVKCSASCPKEYWSMLLDAIEEGIVNDDGLSSLGWLERLCSIECSVPEWVAASAAQRLVRRTKDIVDSYVADRSLFGHKSPLPLHRT
ncbi:hypothetical protein LPJ71_004364, partial [Coemansia sp. S17]